MGLAPNDPKPAKITIREAYERIRVWYQTNISHVSDIDSRAKACLELVERLPEEGNLSDIEIRAVLLELEFRQTGNRQCDCPYMGLTRRLCTIYG